MLKTISAIYLPSLHSFNKIDEREKEIAKSFIRCCLSSICRNRDTEFKTNSFCCPISRYLSFHLCAVGFSIRKWNWRCREQVNEQQQHTHKKTNDHKVKRERNETIHFWFFFRLSFLLAILSTFLVSNSLVFPATFFSNKIILVSAMRSICLYFWIRHTQFGLLNHIYIIQLLEFYAILLPAMVVVVVCTPIHTFAFRSHFSLLFINSCDCLRTISIVLVSVVFFCHSHHRNFDVLNCCRSWRTKNEWNESEMWRFSDKLLSASKLCFAINKYVIMLCASCGRGFPLVVRIYMQFCTCCFCFSYSKRRKWGGLRCDVWATT